MSSPMQLHEARLIRKQLVLEGPVLMNGLVPVLGKVSSLWQEWGCHKSECSPPLLAHSRPFLPFPVLSSAFCQG